MARLEGARLGNYELLEHIGTGGMAEVYRARQLNAFGREVAVKIIKRGFAEQPLFRQRFLREGQATARLAHPHVLPLIELGTAGRKGQTLFLAMPYVREGTLRDLLARTGRPLPVETIAPLFIQLCEAVQYAHGQGLIHRDIKPSNILLQHERYVLLGDFGIALDTEDMRLTSTGMGLGTPEYTAPEQAQGNVDKRSDIYSLGIVLFELLTGQVPFTGRTPFEVLFKQTTATIPSLRSAGPALPATLTRLDAVIQGTLAKEPARRFQTASALGDAFQAALAGAAIAAATKKLPAVIDGKEPTPGGHGMVIENLQAAALAGGAAQAEPVEITPPAEPEPPAPVAFPVAAAAPGGAEGATGFHNGGIAEAESDPLGEYPTSPARQRGKFGDFSARYLRADHFPQRQSRVPMIAFSLLAALLLGGTALVFGFFLLSSGSSNLFNTPRNPIIVPSPGAQHTASPLPTKSPHSHPTTTPAPTTPATPIPSPTSTPIPSPTPSPVPSPTPTAAPPSSTPTP